MGICRSHSQPHTVSLFQRIWLCVNRLIFRVKLRSQSRIKEVRANMSSSPTGCCAVHYTRVGWMFTLVRAWGEGCWELYSKYIEEKHFSYFLSMQETSRYLLTIVAFND